jgi:hypothetical protein
MHDYDEGLRMMTVCKGLLQIPKSLVGERKETGERIKEDLDTYVQLECLIERSLP